MRHRDSLASASCCTALSTAPPPPPPPITLTLTLTLLVLRLGNFFQLHDTSKVESQGWYLYLKNASDDKRPVESECVNRARPVEKGGRVQRGCERPVVEVGCEVQFL